MKHAKPLLAGAAFAWVFVLLSSPQALAGA